MGRQKNKETLLLPARGQPPRHSGERAPGKRTCKKEETVIFPDVERFISKPYYLCGCPTEGKNLHYDKGVEKVRPQELESVLGGELYSVAQHKKQQPSAQSLTPPNAVPIEEETLMCVSQRCVVQQKLLRNIRPEQPLDTSVIVRDLVASEGISPHVINNPALDLDDCESSEISEASSLDLTDYSYSGDS